MTEADPIRCFCGDCGKELPEERHAAAVDRVPCPVCGSLKRHFAAEFMATTESQASMCYKAKSPPGQRRGKSDRRAYREGKVGACPSEITPEGWADVERVICRDTDLYEERVVAPDGAVLHDVKEPLSEHRGHGSAKSVEQRRVSDAESAKEQSDGKTGLREAK